MEARLDDLFEEWGQLGGAVLVADKSQVRSTRTPETVLAETTSYCRDSARLTWVVVDWLRLHIDGIDEQTLLAHMREKGDLSVLGVLCDMANQAQPHPKFRRIMAKCAPNARLEPFFASVARSPMATRLARENALDVFLRWNYWSQEVRYLSPLLSQSKQYVSWGGRRVPGAGKRLGRPAKNRPGRRRLLALWCTEEEWDALLRQLPEDTRERYRELASVMTTQTAAESRARLK